MKLPMDLAAIDLRMAYAKADGLFGICVSFADLETLVACARALRTIAISGDLGGTWCAGEAQRASASVIDTKEEA